MQNEQVIDETLNTGQLILRSERLNYKMSCSFIRLLQNKTKRRGDLEEKCNQN